MGGIRVGRADVKPDTPGHVRGLHQGNHGASRRQAGHRADGTADARRSTGIHWKHHNPVRRAMPNIPPG
ncbi:hypothetical protein GCM10011581_25180 [Saccharopolyspora subtropica]|uniref:Uncharacterized protein n=1 Tax=Saccharopolyspora thermophila TaxID=89367 RepID=A0A917JUQ4_9PSEU|nr:hypothetical protein [Saccharopolyspora subtropica]GGI87084.1 hypothetical protein GCM10011581_25180 [Saccharopolyspora subtropica]